MKKISNAFFGVLLFAFLIVAPLQAQRSIKIGDLNKSFTTKPHFIELPSWNTLGKKDVYIPLFIESYYEVEKDMLVQYDFWFSNSKEYNAKNAGTASYKDSDLSSVFVTKYPISIFSKVDSFGNPMEKEVKKDENNDWEGIFKEDKGAINLMKKYQKPYFKMYYYLQKGKEYTVEQYDMKKKAKVETEKREASEYMQTLKFHNKADAENTLKKLLALLK